MAKALLMKHDQDPRDDIAKKLAGYIKKIDVFGNDVLVAIYERPGKTMGGVFLPDKTLGEDEFQGKVGLIVKVGPLAFRDGEWFGAASNGNDVPKVGDWIVFRVSDAWPFKLPDIKCRIIEDKLVRARISQPDMVY